MRAKVQPGGGSGVSETMARGKEKEYEQCKSLPQDSLARRHRAGRHDSHRVPWMVRAVEGGKRHEHHVLQKLAGRPAPRRRDRGHARDPGPHLSGHRRPGALRGSQERRGQEGRGLRKEVGRIREDCRLHAGAFRASHPMQGGVAEIPRIL